jgi:hypothetical protein
MVGQLKNSSRLVSRTDVLMHADADFWVIRQIEGLGVAEEIYQVMVGTKKLVTRSRAAMELEGITAEGTARKDPEIARKMMISMRTRAATTKGTIPVATTTLMTWRISIDEIKSSEDEYWYL